MKKRRLLIVFILTLFIMSLFTVPTFANPAAHVIVDGRLLQFDVPPTIIQGRTLVPLRGIFEALGVEPHWNSQTQTVTAQTGTTEIILPIGSRFPTVNGLPVELDVPGTIVEGRTLVPARFIAESLGAEVNWIQETRTVVITSSKKEVKPAPVPEPPLPAPVKEDPPKPPEPKPESTQPSIPVVQLGESIRKNGLDITIHEIRYNEDGFRLDDKWVYSIRTWPKGFGVYFTITNNTESAYILPKFYFEVEPKMYEDEINNSGWHFITNVPRDTQTRYIYPGEFRTGFKQYRFLKDIDIIEIKTGVRKPEDMFRPFEPFGIWVAR